MASATVSNAGSITGTAAVKGCISRPAARSADTGTASRISGGASGVYASGAAATISNQGSIIGTADHGVFLSAGGAVTNSGTTALIDGNIYGVAASGGRRHRGQPGQHLRQLQRLIYLGAGGGVEQCRQAGAAVGRALGRLRL